jgi:uncharacterized membrane protein (UPF0127 family)
MNDVIYLKHNPFVAKVAVTANEQSVGLMFASWPPPVMVFPYKKADIRKFWMLNTTSPLDIVYCYAGKVVRIIAGEPLSTKLVGPDEPVDLVVELPAGTASSIGLAQGDDATFRPSIRTSARILLEG